MMSIPHPVIEVNLAPCPQLRLRPGSTYAVIAEYQGDDGIITGRTQAKANQVGVRISLQPRGGESNQGHASIQPARPRVEPISNIDPVD